MTANRGRFVWALGKLVELVAMHETLAIPRDRVIDVGAPCVPWAPDVCVADRTAESPFRREVEFRSGIDRVSVRYGESGEILDVTVRDRRGRVASFVLKLASDPESVLEGVVRGYYTIAGAAQLRLPPSSGAREELARFMRSLEDLYRELFGGAIAPDEDMQSTLMRLYDYRDRLESVVGTALRQTVESIQDARLTSDRVFDLHLAFHHTVVDSVGASVFVNFTAEGEADEEERWISVYCYVYENEMPVILVTTSASFGADVVEEKPKASIHLLRYKPIGGELLAALEAVRCFVEKLPELPSRLYQVLEDYGLVVLRESSTGASECRETVELLERRREDVKARWKRVNLRELFRGVWPQLELQFKQAGFRFSVSFSYRESPKSKQLLSLRVSSELYAGTRWRPGSSIMSVLLTTWSKDPRGRPSYVRIDVLRPDSMPLDLHFAPLPASGVAKINAVASLIANPTKLVEFLSRVKSSAVSLMRCT